MAHGCPQDKANDRTKTNQKHLNKNIVWVY